MEVNFYNLTLRRYPHHPKDLLLPVDASDELVVDYLRKENFKKILVIEDRFGAITLGAIPATFMFLNDSYVSHAGFLENTLVNSLDHKEMPVRYKDISEIGNFDEIDAVVLKMPKSLQYFEDLVISLSQKLRPQTQIICPAMIKHLPKTAFEILEKYFGKTWTSLAVKKARLIFSKLERNSFKENGVSFFNLSVEGFAYPFTNYSNVFCGSKLDIGTRFLLDHLPSSASSVMDLGCGNGILGISYKLKNPSSKLTFVDESWMAIKSANENYKKYFKDEADFVWTNCYEEKEGNFDLILCNPPFHQQNIVGDFIARQMFKDAARVLNPGGVLRIVGNRHLNYHVTLKKYFKNVEIIASNSKFVIIDAKN